MIFSRTFSGFSIIPILILTMSFFACQGDKKIVNKQEIQHYLHPSEAESYSRIDQIDESMKFWREKLAKQPQAAIFQVRVAGLLSEKFALQGDPSFIRESDALLHSALEGALLKKSSALHALAQNAITQHEFEKARKYAQIALETREDPDYSRLILFDANMELGKDSEAEAHLDSIEYKGTVAFAIRKSKLQDVKGNLNEAIATIEQIADKYDEGHYPQMYCWVMSNLGDMYGHAGAIQKSYKAYLSVLEIDPTYTYSLKGIAWIAYSHDRNLELAREISSAIWENSKQPYALLQLADYAAYEGDGGAEAMYLQQYIDVVQSPDYGRMYDKYLAEIYGERLLKPQEARKYIDRELANRPNAEIYDLLAWNHYLSGDHTKAREIGSEFVIDKTEEPVILYHQGMIALAAGEEETGKNLLKTAEEAEFELGPVISADIRAKLK